MPLILLPSLIPTTTTSPCYHWMPSDEVSANKHTVQRLRDWIYSKALPPIISSSVSCWWSPTLLRSKDAPNEREALWNELGPPLAPASMPTSSLSRLHQPSLIIEVQATVHTSTTSSLFRIRQLRASESNLFKSRRKMLTIWPRRDKSRWSHCRFLLIACWENEMLASQAQSAVWWERKLVSATRAAGLESRNAIGIETQCGTDLIIIVGKYIRRLDPASQRQGCGVQREGFGPKPKHSN